jgi:hypothetical protein
MKLTIDGRFGFESGHTFRHVVASQRFLQPTPSGNTAIGGRAPCFNTLSYHPVSVFATMV